MSPRASTPSAKPATTQQAPSPRLSASRSRARTRKSGTVSAEDRCRYIAEAAYFKAEMRGFERGKELEDWIAAEAEIDALLDSRGAG